MERARAALSGGNQQKAVIAARALPARGQAAAGRPAHARGGHRGDGASSTAQPRRRPRAGPGGAARLGRPATSCWRCRTGSLRDVQGAGGRPARRRGAGRPGGRGAPGRADDRRGRRGVTRVAILREAFVLGISLLSAMAAGSLLILALGASPRPTCTACCPGPPGATPTEWAGAVQGHAAHLHGAVGGARRSGPGLFNIGAEGQLAWRLRAAAWWGSACRRRRRRPLAIAACRLAGPGRGAVRGAVPGALKARFGAHEVIATIMLNFWSPSRS
ncbi:MAG: hypothetical protein MZW92_01960 [Comamonadaceae bacterium]|nr:hypothetical protein [Comamonadaceae bacterium]